MDGFNGGSEQVLGPVARARVLFELAKDRPRQEVINLAVSVGGVKRSTANTQYQNWKKGH